MKENRQGFLSRSIHTNPMTFSEGMGFASACRKSPMDFFDGLRRTRTRPPEKITEVRGMGRREWGGRKGSVMAGWLAADSGKGPAH